MHPSLQIFFVAALALRLFSLGVSRRHERILRARGAVEYGTTTSRVLGLLHAAFYATALAEALARRTVPDLLTAIGVTLYLGSMGVLALVIRELGDLWTVKLYLSPGHELHRGGLFHFIRHPNYFLNMVPELVGLALALHAWWTLALLLPFYLLTLRKRIVQEEEAMRARFPAYGRAPG